MKSYYEILDLEEGAPKEEIRRAFYRLAKKFHPDISKDHKRFLQILGAYKTLTDEQKIKGNNKSMEKKSIIPTVIPKSRVTYAVSLKDIAKLQTFNPGKGGGSDIACSLRPYKHVA